MEVPITTTSWKILKIYPTIFRKGSELVEITNVSDYLLEHEYNEHLLFSIDELKQCHSSTRNIFCCTFDTFHSHLNTCETDSRYGHKLDKCQTKPSIDKQKIIGINESMIYLNKLQDQRVIWGCFDFLYPLPQTPLPSAFLNKNIKTNSIIVFHLQLLILLHASQ